MKKQLVYLFVILGGLYSCQNNQDPTPTDCNTSNLDMTVSATTAASGCNTLDGEIQLSATGGDGTYTYKLDNGNFQSSSTFSGLNAGFYAITVRDGGGCEVVIETSLNSANGVNITDVVTTESGCGTSNASITVTATGSGTLQYKLEEAGTYAESNTITNVGAGTYTLFVLDGTGCEATSEITIKTGLPFSTFQDIINQSCATTVSCHGAGTTRTDFTIDQNLVDRAATIKTRTGNGSMPPGAPLSDADKQTIACWVDDGAIIN